MARRPYQYARVVQPDECLITNQEVWEFESPRALHHSQGVGKLGNPPALEAGDRGIEARLPDQLREAVQLVEHRALNVTVPGSKAGLPTNVTTWPNVEARGCNPRHAG